MILFKYYFSTYGVEHFFNVASRDSKKPGDIHLCNFLIILTLKGMWPLISHKDLLKFQAGFAQRLMGALVERRKKFSSDRIFPEELKEVQEGKIVDGGNKWYYHNTYRCKNMKDTDFFFSDALFQALLFK